MLGLSVLSQLRIDKSKSADETDNFSCCRLFCCIVGPPPLAQRSMPYHPSISASTHSCFCKGRGTMREPFTAHEHNTSFPLFQTKKHFNMQPNKWITSESTDYLRLRSVAEFLIQENRNKRRFFLFFLSMSLYHWAFFVYFRFVTMTFILIDGNSEGNTRTIALRMR